MSHPNLLDVTQWGLPAAAITTLQSFPELVPELATARTLPPLPPGYLPSVVEVLFDDVPYLRSVEGVLTLARDCLPGYQPRCVAYHVDDELAFFQIGEAVVVNRLEGIAQIQWREASCRS